MKLNEKINKWTLIEFRQEKINNGKSALFRCDCGEEKIHKISSVKLQQTKQCYKCTGRRSNEKNNYHGDSLKKSQYYYLYKCWKNMSSRCFQEKDNHYYRYGGRGITVDKSWYDYLIFKEWALNNGWELGLSIDRIDVDGNYEPSNCRWIALEENVKYSTEYHYEYKSGLFSKESKEKSKQSNRTNNGIKVKVFNDVEEFICNSIGEAADILSVALNRNRVSVYSQCKQALKGKCLTVGGYYLEKNVHTGGL